MSKPSVIVPTPDYNPSLKMGAQVFPFGKTWGVCPQIWGYKYSLTGKLGGGEAPIFRPPSLPPSLKMGVLGAMPPNGGVWGAKPPIFRPPRRRTAERRPPVTPPPRGGASIPLRENLGAMPPNRGYKFSRKGILLGCAAKRRLRRGEATFFDFLLFMRYNQLKKVK